MPVKFLTIKFLGCWLLLLFMVGVWLGLSPNTAYSSAIVDPQRDATVMNAADIDVSESEDDDEDDEWEA
jgi:hypothetical protein